MQNPNPLLTTIADIIDTILTLPLTEPKPDK